MTTTTAIEIDDHRLAHRKACAYLKGCIIGYAHAKGMKWNGDICRTTEFKMGYESKFHGDTITFLHIIYNRLRHDKPHLSRDEGQRLFEELRLA